MAPILPARVGRRAARADLISTPVTLTGVALGVLVSLWFLALPALAGLNQLLMVATGWCPMSLLLRRLGVPESAVSCG